MYINASDFVDISLEKDYLNEFPPKLSKKFRKGNQNLHIAKSQICIQIFAICRHENVEYENVSTAICEWDLNLRGNGFFTVVGWELLSFSLSSCIPFSLSLITDKLSPLSFRFLVVVTLDISSL